MTMEGFSRYSISVTAVFLVQLVLSSAFVGLSGPVSIARLAAFPIVSYCVYYIIVAASSQMRFHWVGLYGGMSFVMYLQFIDLALLSGWSYETHAQDQGSEETSKSVSTKGTNADPSQDQSTGLWPCFRFGWNSMWSLRHINTRYEVRNVPSFSKNPKYVPTRWAFAIRRAFVAVLCYLVVDFIDSQPPPPSRDIFDSSLIPIFSRLREVTAEQLIVRSATLMAFTLTFYCVIQGSYSAVAAVATATGLSDVKNWRPLFGSLSDAYSVQNVWGKFWHQCLRHMIVTPASEISQNVFGMRKGSLADTCVTTSIAFQISGVMHCAAAAAGGRPWLERHVLQFFAIQAFGLFLERAFQRFCRGVGKGRWFSSRPTFFFRLLGHIWVAAFMTWSGAIWIYPPASRPPPEGSFVPFSVVEYIRNLYADNQLIISSQR